MDTFSISFPPYQWSTYLSLSILWPTDGKEKKKKTSLGCPFSGPTIKIYDRAGSLKMDLEKCIPTGCPLANGREEDFRTTLQGQYAVDLEEQETLWTHFWLPYYFLYKILLSDNHHKLERHQRIRSPTTQTIDDRGTDDDAMWNLFK